MPDVQEKYDVIIIGSGIGGLAAGAVLSRVAGKKVLILERHFKAGGFTHIFKRESKYEWDVGLHYLGELHEGTLNRRIFDFVTDGQIDWQPMPDVYDVFDYPDNQFKVRKGREQFKSDLINAFPAERDAIENYFRDLRQASNWLRDYYVGLALPPVIKKIQNILTASKRNSALITTGEYLKRNFNDEQLKAILVSQWGDYGLPPAQSAFAIHAAIANHYLRGGYFPSGGSGRIAKSAISLIEQNGGKCLLNSLVKEIIVRNGKAIGVKVESRKSGQAEYAEYFAEQIISNAGAYTTYNQLMPEQVRIPFREELNTLQMGPAHVSLYLGSDKDLREFGFSGENYWLFDSYDHDDIFARRNDLLDGKAHMCYLTFPSLKNPQAEGGTMEIIVPVDYEPFLKWKDQPWKKRDSEYQKLKQDITDTLLEFVEKRFPGFKGLVAYSELSTPLSTEFFTGHHNGAIYGLPATPERFRKSWLGFRTPLKNLYLTGADAGTHGISGALMSGVLCAGLALGFPGGIKRVLKAVKEQS